MAKKPVSDIKKARAKLRKQKIAHAKSMTKKGAAVSIMVLAYMFMGQKIERVFTRGAK